MLPFPNSQTLLPGQLPRFARMELAVTSGFIYSFNLYLAFLSRLGLKEAYN